MAQMIKSAACAVLAVAIFCSGCGLSAPAPKPEVGPTGKPVESKPNPPLVERFWSAPAELYDLEATAGVVFEGINKADWEQAEAGLNNLQALWQQTKTVVGEKKGVKEGDEAMDKLTRAVAGRQITASYESLTKFMGSVSDIGKSYKLSPVADVINIGNSARNVSFYVEDKNWSKAAAKAKELEGVWQQGKPALEQIGILGEVTRTSSIIKQVKDAVNAENKGAVEEQLANLNESMGRIRDFYRGR
ncbi:hypothetical protein SAMN05660235_00969 [Sporolituus thermophilus DSM 23256]|uniref:Lipoprotein n=2 Tax=Sporolituus TaxID=909931 RepID=A0A1G7JKQ7_9FIRM|nr:hypothetical protein SAMN05660235_00969 [Sporolituus thermophilus DSM 23256]